MSSQRLRCLCGHSWERTVPGPVPADIRTICPVCTPGVDAGNTHPEVAAARPESTLKPGDVLAGFEILRPINRGGMGVVYKARQIGLDRLAALKVIAPERLGDADYVERFRREVRAAALLNHPNIVTVYATDLSGTRPYLAMEFVDGIDLYRLVQHSGPLGFLESCSYVRQAAEGLQHAFERSLVHRDIKPHNLMVTPSPLDSAAASDQRRSPVIKILDMGLARLEGPDKALEEGLTQAGEFVGTPDYAAPEQAEDPRLADIRADLYSLGATWFFLLTGDVPFPGTTLMQKWRKQLTEPTPLVTDRCPDIPLPLTALIRKLMDRDPKQRFQTPVELVDAITAYLRNPSRTWAAVPGTAPEKPLVVPAHPGGVMALCLSSDGSMLLTGGGDEVLRIWEAPALEKARTVAGDPGPVCGVAMTGSGKWGASCALRLLQRDMVVQLWDLGAGIERWRLPGPRASLTSIAMTRDGRRLAAGCEDGTIHLWTLDPPNSPALRFQGHSGAVTGLAFVPGDGALISVGHDGASRRWDLTTRRGETVLQGEAGALRAVASAGGCLALAGERLLIRQPDGTLRTLG
ncbi:MAG TPA: serine/threonine-protein kinase, partial [Gemmataceae bacterium]|nr:serine/threonine-protein kinase [Gemmataceae bacterium]